MNSCWLMGRGRGLMGCVRGKLRGGGGLKGWKLNDAISCVGGEKLIRGNVGGIIQTPCR